MVNQSPNFINRLKELKRIAAKMVSWFWTPHFTLKITRSQRILNDGRKDGCCEDRDDCSSLSLDSIPWFGLWLGLRLGLWVTRCREGGRRVAFLCCAEASDVPAAEVSALLVSTGYGVSRSLFTWFIIIIIIIIIMTILMMMMTQQVETIWCILNHVNQCID